MNPVYTTFLAYKESVQVYINDEGKWVATFFINSENDERILICHGTDKGIWPKASSDAIAKHNPDKVFCCHPLIMKQRTRDLRIQGVHNDQVMCTTYGLDSEANIITVVLNRHERYHL